MAGFGHHDHGHRAGFIRQPVPVEGGFLAIPTWLRAELVGAPFIDAGQSRHALPQVEADSPTGSCYDIIVMS